MDRHPSAIKRHRQSRKRNEQNRATRSRMRTHIKNVEVAEAKEVAEGALKTAIKALDTSATARIIHPNKAARLKSRLSRMVATRFAG